MTFNRTPMYRQPLPKDDYCVHCGRFCNGEVIIDTLPYCKDCGEHVKPRYKPISRKLKKTDGYKIAKHLPTDFFR